MKNKYEYWLGDESSLAAYLQALEGSLNPDLRLRASEDASESQILSQHGSTAVISIQGSLLPFSNWMTQMMGLTGYPDIRDALVEAAQDDSIDHILLDINSPGGSASGIEDISSLMKKIDKPITAYTNGTMASAAYWIGVSADKVYSSPLASVGSIGVIATHFDQTKALENEGVKATIFRAGEFKALGGPYEVLTDAAKGIIQSRLDSLYESFIVHVADSRGVSTKIVHDKMADGREFLGHEALQAGLVDGNMSIDDLMMQLSSVKSSNGRTSTTRMEASEMAKKLLNQQAAAALAAGATLEDALDAVPEPAELEPPTPETPEAPETPIEAPEVPAAVEDAALTTYLKTELASVNEKMLQAAMDSRNLQAKLDNLSITHDQMRTIVADSINIKRVALGGSNTDLSSLGDEALVQQYQHASAEFSKVFPIGGRVQMPDPEKPVGVSAGHLARVKASKI